MANDKERVIVVLSLSGGNDGLNTVIPYSDPQYKDYRPTIGVQEDDVLRLNDDVGFLIIGHKSSSFLD